MSTRQGVLPNIHFPGVSRSIGPEHDLEGHSKPDPREAQPKGIETLGVSQV